MLRIARAEDEQVLLPIYTHALRALEDRRFQPAFVRNVRCPRQ
jgi:hypothetical protein